LRAKKSAICEKNLTTEEISLLVEPGARIALDADTVAILRHQRETQQLERDLLDRPIRTATSYSPTSWDGRSTRSVSRSGSPSTARRRASPPGSLHVLRHTSATLALTATPPVPLHVVEGRPGDDPRTVLSTYAHLLPHSDAMAADAVAEALVDKPLTGSEAPEPQPAL
jgi:integrase